MATSAWRRRFRQWKADHDWLEGVSVVLGGVFLLVAVACVWGLVVALTSLGHTESGLSAEPSVLSNSSGSTVQATRWFGIVLFSIFALLAAAGGWLLAGEWVRRAVQSDRAAA